MQDIKSQARELSEAELDAVAAAGVGELEVIFEGEEGLSPIIGFPTEGLSSGTEFPDPDPVVVGEVLGVVFEGEEGLSAVIGFPTEALSSGTEFPDPDPVWWCW